MIYKTVNLGKLCAIFDTLRKPITKKFRKHGQYPYYGATGIVDYVDSYIFDETLVLIGEDGAKWDRGEQTAFIVSGKYWVNNHAHVIKPYQDKLNQKFLVYYLNSLDLKPWVTGLTVPKLNQEKLKSIPIPLPSIKEQQRIVAKLDEAFTEIDKSIQFSKEKIENINFLKNQFLEIKLNKINVKDSVLINDFCYTSDFVANGSFASLAANVKYLDNEDYAILVRLTDYRKNFKSKLKYVSKKSYEFLKHSKLKEGDLVLTNVGAYSGTPFLIPRLNKPSTLGPNAILVRPDNKIMNNEYLKIFFESNKGQFLLNSISTGTTHKKFNKTSLRKMEIKIPKLKEQMDIINKIGEFNKEVNHFKMNEELVIKNYVSLKKSIFENILNKNELAA